jgi:hypothetical protein
VDPLVLIVNVEEQLGLQAFEENEAVAPAGKPEAENVTGCVAPDTNVVPIEFVTEKPAVTDLSPAFAREKSNG